MTTQYFSLYQDGHHIPAAFCLPHRDRRISLTIPLLDPVTTRSALHACGKPIVTDHDKQATENREPANEMNKEDQTQVILVRLQPFSVDLEDLEVHVLAHSSERANSDSEVTASKLETQKNGSTVFMLAFAKKKGDLEQSPIRCRGTSSRHSMESMSNQNFTRDGEEFTKVPKPSQKPKVIHTYSLLELASIVKNYHGIIEQLHFINQIRAELQNELYVEQQKRDIIAVWIEW